uniref:MULE transposase domain-containing protein n=1 Tax=Plectus sambesii TaxID=2011161 RepID=A0A914XJW7_9BILA
MKAAQSFDLFRKIAKSPLKKQHYVMLWALAFLLPADIPAAFDVMVQHIRQHHHEANFKDLLDYMEKTWVAPMCNPNRPMLGKFPPLIWSVHTHTLINEDRTNNKVEGWHLKINRFMESCHLSFYVFLNELKKFFWSKEDRRREQQRATIERAAHIEISKVLSPIRDFNSLQSTAFRILCQNYQNQLYVTNPQSAGTIRFLSEVADALTKKYQ